MMEKRIIFTAPSELQKGIEILLQYGIEENKIDYIDKLKSGLLVNDCYFENFPIDLLFTELQYEIKFVNCKFNSLECYCGHKTMRNSFIFEKCEFNGFYLINDQQFCDLFQINNQIYFICCIFNCNLIIGRSCANYEIKFHNCEINGIFNIDFKECLNFFQLVECVFMEKVFIRGRFKDNVYLNNSVFYDYVYFYESKFEKIACFYGVTFEKTPNFSQAIFKGNLNVVNTNLNFTFDDLQEKIKQEYEEFNKKNEQNKKALDKFANDFRDSFRVFKNALIKDNNLLDASNFHKYELYCKELELKNKKGKTFKDVVDRWQLFFYRKLCDHHTDLILNLKWFVAIVGFFASILFALRYGDGNLMQFFNKDNDLLKILKNILNINALNDSGAVCLIAMYSFMGLLFVRTFFIFYYLIIFILTIAISPISLFSIINLAIKHETNSFLENIIIIVYTLSMVLIIFSLQKTARKNSIVPS